jgi:hypothetical protein
MVQLAILGRAPYFLSSLLACAMLASHEEFDFVLCGNPEAGPRGEDQQASFVAAVRRDRH